MELYQYGSECLTAEQVSEIKKLGNSLGMQALHVKHDPDFQLTAIIAIHNTTLGSALGGCRCLDYSNVLEGVKDAMILAMKMTYKAAMAGLPLGGGKMVLLKPAHLEDRVEYFRAAGRFVEEVNQAHTPHYITAQDAGVSTEDVDMIATQTKYVVGTSGYDEDPSVYTVQGVLLGIRAAVNFQLGLNTLKGVRFSIQGAGRVGSSVLEYLHGRGAVLTVCDDHHPEMLEKLKKKFNVGVVGNDLIYDVPADVFVPCALGGVINDQTIPRLVRAGVKVISGAANNQLQDEKRHGEELMRAGILYAPDYVINSGGLIYAATQVPEANHDLEGCIENIGFMLTRLFSESRQLGVATNAHADAMAEAKFKQ